LRTSNATFNLVSSLAVWGQLSLLIPYGVEVFICFFHFDYFTGGSTPWMSDKLFRRSLPTHKTTQTQNKHIHIPNIHALCGIRTHDPSFRASEDSSCFRPLGYLVRRQVSNPCKTTDKIIDFFLILRPTLLSSTPKKKWYKL
jgi:hypothetical protein